MSRILIATLPVVGHVAPILPLAAKLVERGHEVAWYTGKNFQSKIEATGARYLPMVVGRDLDDLDKEATLAGREKLKGIAQIKFDIKFGFIGPMPGHIEDIENILKTYPADVLVGDTAFSAGAIISKRNNLPWAIVNITVLSLPSVDAPPFGLGIMPGKGVFGRLHNRFLYWMADKMVFRDVYAYYYQLAAEQGWPEVGGVSIPMSSPYLFIQPTVPGFEYTRSDLPPQAHYVGPMLPPTPKAFTPPEWWDEVVNSAKLVVLVTQGTVATDADQLVAPTLQALANEDVLVIATADPETLKGDIPANARVVPFVPFAHLMPHVSVMVTNGGYGGTTIALAHGVPIVSGGISEDKAEVSNRIAYSGVGINLKTATPTPEQVRKAVKEILSNSRYRHNARHMQAEFAEYDGPTQASRLLEQLARTGQPVYADPSQTAEIDTVPMADWST
jgi:UDP:flavonoid glycosyltransferase YjiC (YdhE family)